MSSLLVDLARCTRCQASAHDHVETIPGKRGRGECWIVQCALCGYRDRIDAPATPPAAAESPACTDEEYRLKFGRFAGMTLAEADAQPNGRRYLEHMLANNQALAPRIAAYLQQKGA